MNVGNALQQAGLSLLGETGTRVVFRSNITPDITIDIAGLMKAKAEGLLQDGDQSDMPITPTVDPEEVPVSSSDKRLLKFIRPQIALNVLGNQLSYAPYGRPKKLTAIIFTFSLIASAIIGAKIAWTACKKV
jgi:hypothetical protein